MKIQRDWNYDAATREAMEIVVGALQDAERPSDDWVICEDRGRIRLITGGGRNLYELQLVEVVG